MNGIKSIKEIKVEGKRVFVRVDFNVPLDQNGNVADNTRIVAALPTIRYLLERGAKVILASHLGRPKGQKNLKYTLRPVAEALATLLNQPVLFLDDCVGSDVEAHRAHASTAGMVPYVAEKAVGFLIEKELEFLCQKVDQPARPFCVVLGGAKVSDKIGVIESVLDKADRILIGGAMAYTFALAEGRTVGNSRVEPDFVDLAKQLLAKAKEKGVDLQLPIDTVTTNKVDFDNRTLGELKVFEGSIEEGWEGVDIGPKTAEKYAKIIRDSKTVLWNGPVGIFEIEASAQGSYKIAQAMAACEGTTIIGGGDCVKAVHQSGCADEISFLSTGGGASLQLLEGKPLPGLEALKQ